MKVLIIGAGGQGSQADAPGSGNEHKVISFVHAFKEHENRFTPYICDRDKEKESIASRKWNIPIRDKNDTDFDIYVIATPDDTHYGILRNITYVSRKPKLVICEKPLCESLEQMEEIVELYEKLGIPLLVNFTRRFIPEYRKLYYDYTQGKLGKLLYGRCNFNRGILHTGTHAVDVFNWFTEGDFSNIELFESKITEYRVWELYLLFDYYEFYEHRIGAMPVPAYFDYHTRYVLENVINFLDGTEDLFCNGRDALKGAEKLCLITKRQKQ